MKTHLLLIAFFIATGFKANSQAWFPMGAGLDNTVNSIGNYNSDIYAGGAYLTNQGNVNPNKLAKWNGSTWSSTGLASDGQVNRVDSINGFLYVGGLFTAIGGTSASNIAKWNGSTFSSVGAGLNGEVFAIKEWNGNIYAGGGFDSAGTTVTHGIAKWTGSTWSGLGTGMDDTVYAFADYNSELFAGGRFTTAGGNACSLIAKWNGTAWAAVGAGLSANLDAVYTMAIYNGYLYAAGSFDSAGGTFAHNIAKWDGAVWSNLGDGVDGKIYAMSVYNGELLVAGSFATAGGISVNNMAKWNGTAWSSFGPGTNGPVRSLLNYGSKLYLGGNFTLAGDSSVSSMASYCVSPTAPLAIIGDTFICAGSTKTYNATPVAVASSYTWVLPNGWTGSSSGTSISVTPDSTSGTISVRANSACGLSQPTLFQVTTIKNVPDTPGTVTGNINICPGTPNTYNIAAVAGAKSYTWTLPSTWSGTSIVNSIIVTAGAVSGNVEVTANNVCGQSGARLLAVSVNPVPDPPGAITGNTTVCSGTANTYSISPVTGATAYNWTLPSGWTGTSTTTTINTTAGSTGNISVVASNVSCSSIPENLFVNVNTLPGSTGPITGNTVVCQGSTNIYNVTAAAGASSYTWTLPTGWTGSSTTTSISITAGSGAGTITVKANNSCGSSPSKTLNVSVVSSVPATPALIHGDTVTCINSPLTFSVDSVAGVTSYTWSLPTGWTGTSTTRSISATSGTVGGVVMVMANNVCGPSTAKSITVGVNLVPAKPTSITGLDTMCKGISITYTVTPVSGATKYLWTLPSGWTGTSTTNVINTISGNGSGAISVKANNLCGSSASLTFPVIVKAIDTSLSLSGFTLNSKEAGAIYQWVDCATKVPVPGATFVNFGPTKSGSYKVIIAKYGCSDTSSCWTVIKAGAEEYLSPEWVDIIPNPTNGKITVTSDKIELKTVEIYNILGEKILEKKADINNQKQLEMNLGESYPGVYLVVIKAESGAIIKKVVKQ